LPAWSRPRNHGGAFRTPALLDIDLSTPKAPPSPTKRRAIISYDLRTVRGTARFERSKLERLSPGKRNRRGGARYGDVHVTMNAGVRAFFRCFRELASFFTK
jgi:hypothetical protein